MKKEIYVVIEASKDYYDAYAENVAGIFGAGATIDECKKDLEASIAMQKPSLPKWIQNDNYKIVYKYDTQSLLQYYSSIITMSALAKRAGINPKQLQHYSSGVTIPRQPQRIKIVNAINQLGQEMTSVRL